MIRYFTSVIAFVFLSHDVYAKSLETLITEIEQVRDEYSISAAGLSIIKHGKLVYSDGLGTLGHEDNTAVNQDSIFRIGSITKSFTALAALKLAEQDQLNLQQSVHTSLPKNWIENAWRKTHPVTVSTLLEHTAGFSALSKEEFDLQNDSFDSLSKTLERYKQKHSTQWPPGAYHSYSNLGSAFVGYLIEEASGLSYESFLDQNIFTPLNMNDSHFFLTSNLKSKFVLGYDTDGTTPIPYWHMTYRPFGGINTSVNDMNNFLFMLLNRGESNGEKLLNKTSIIRMESPKTTLANQNSVNLSFGYGLGIYKWINRGVLFHGHGGDADGYLSRFGYTRSSNSAYFHVINAFNHKAHKKINALVEDFILGEHKQTQFPEKFRLSTKAIEAISGVYQPQTFRFQNRKANPIEIVSDSGVLYTRIGKNTEQLIPVSEVLFRRLNETQATIAIFEHEGKLIYQGKKGSFKK